MRIAARRIASPGKAWIASPNRISRRTSGVALVEPGQPAFADYRREVDRVCGEEFSALIS